MSTTPKAAHARALVRSLNLLLKSARLYGLDHVRCNDQFHAVWSDLQKLLALDDQGCLLGIAGKQLLADGAPVEVGPAEKSFVDVLASAGLASVQFTTRTSPEEMQRFVRGFASIGPKSEAAAEQLKQALVGGDGTICLNAVRYVAEDAALGDSAISARLAAAALGGGGAALRDALDNPQQLLQLIAAAVGQGPVSGPRSTSGEAQPSTPAAPAAPVPANEADALNLLRTIADIARTGTGTAAEAGAPLPQQLSELPASSQELFRQSLAGLAAMAPANKPDAPMLVQLAEHLAIRFALEQFGRGDVRVNSVRETLEKASREIATLRKILTGHEQVMAKAGIVTESHADLLDRQFWIKVPEGGKREALLSPEAWCIPPRNVRQFVEELFSRKDGDTAAAILLNYVACAGHTQAEARKKTAVGIVELAGLCSRAEAAVLGSALRCVGEQLTWEQDGQVQEALSNAYARLTQEAVAQKNLTSLQTALTWLDHAAREKPDLARSLRPRLGVEDRLPEFVEDAIRAKETPAELVKLLQHAAQPVASLLAARFGRCTRREECQRVMEVFSATGAEGVVHLREVLRAGTPAEAADTIGLLSRFGSAQVERLVVSRISGWNRAQHDTVVRQLALGAAPERGRLLARLFPLMDDVVLPEVVDEIGLCGDATASGLLIKLAIGEMPQAADPFLRVKAIEGLSRLREKHAVPLLREIASAKEMWRWVHGEEMRVVALQALGKLDPQWARAFAPQSGLNAKDLALAPLDIEESPWARQRRYARVSLPRNIQMLASTNKGEVPFESNLLSLGGGMSAGNAGLQAGSHGTVQIKSGWRSFSADVIFRGGAHQQCAFEIVEIKLEDRARLRRLLSGFAA